MRDATIKVLLSAVLVPGVLALGACSSNELEPPTEPGACYYIVPPETEGEEAKVNLVASNQPQIELCAARLEEMRVNFLRIGGSNTEIMGAYQGQFIFINARGVYFGQSLTGPRYIALARTGDGRLAVPGAIVRDEHGRPIAVAESPAAE